MRMISLYPRRTPTDAVGHALLCVLATWRNLTSRYTLDQGSCRRMAQGRLPLWCMSCQCGCVVGCWMWTEGEMIRRSFQYFCAKSTVNLRVASRPQIGLVCLGVGDHY